ncbi:sulfurtransferase TusA family protein [Marinobacterium sp. YM272]|uniref:sulfurtransferase TusA family protein n=1 Tax=Marinobacterium sp. YM272 TaxID=3421654 RepID=UPI003D7F9085
MQHTPTESEITEQLDASGLACPLPLLKAKQALSRMAPGEVLKVIATDSGSVRDFRVYVDNSDHEMLDSFTEGESYIHIIRRGTMMQKGGKTPNA